MHMCYWGIICLCLTSLVIQCSWQTSDLIGLSGGSQDTRLRPALSFLPVPQNLQVTSRTNESIETRWDLPSSVYGTQLYKYTVYATPTKSAISLTQHSCTTNANSCRVTDLIANTAYNLMVQACYAQAPKLCGVNSKPLIGYTRPGVPLDLRVLEASATDIVVTWNEPTPSTEPITKYEVGVTDNLGKNWTCEFVKDEGHKCRIAGLSACHVINVTVRACARDGDCGISAYETGPSPPPSDNLLKILLGTLIPLIFIILLVLLFVFRKRIPFIRNLFSKGPTAKNSKPNATSRGLSPPFPIEYYTPPGPKTLSNLPPPIPIENFAANLRELDANNGFQALFQTLNSLAASEIVEKYRLTKVAATQGGNRNRYSDMPPYDQSLVLVGRPWSTVINDPQPQITASEVEKGYINASYVRRPEYGSGGEALVSSFSTRPAYIATQGPLRSTVADFLTMVCQQRCRLIIMLCQCIEGGKIKCTQYWPEGMMSTFKSKNCSVEVRKESEENLGSVIRRELKMHPSSEASPWTVTQFHFTDWAGNGVPNMESFYNLVVMQNDFLATHPMGVECGPTIVHCSAGVGRTGTFMAARFLLDRLRTNPQNVDIVGTVLAMRKWRANLVQVWSQLQFLYNFIDFCLGKENLGVKQIAPGPKALPAAPSAEYQNIGEQSEMNAMEPARPPVPPKRNP